jgi:hypothetical protein
MPALLRRTALALAVLLLAAGCGGDDDEGGFTGPITDEYAVGVWRLRDVNGLSLPFTTVLSEQGRVQVVSGRVIIGADRSFRDEQVLRVRVAGQRDRDTTVVVTGTWTREDSDLTITVPGGGTFPGTFFNDRFLKLEGGLIYAYRK